jgi:hypothetical protein
LDRRARNAFCTLALSSLVFGAAAWLLVRERESSIPSVVLNHAVREQALLLERRKLERPEQAPAASSFTLDREPIDERTARVLFGQIGNRMSYDPLAYYRPGRERGKHRVWKEHPEGGWSVSTNSLGMRGKEEVRETHPDLRVLVVGDSHSFGLCAADETFSHLLEMRLRSARHEKTFEVLNASVGGYDPFNYLGVVERAKYAVAQEIGQVLYFLANPEDELVAVQTTTAIAAEALERCESIGAKLVCVYLPPPGTAQPDPGLEYLAPALAEYELGADELCISGRMADSWLTALRERGISTVDMRPLFHSAPTPCYWRRDLHLDVDGNRLVAGALTPIVVGLME